LLAAMIYLRKLVDDTLLMGDVLFDKDLEVKDRKLKMKVKCG
jgi:hypothetical protein